MLPAGRSKMQQQQQVAAAGGRVRKAAGGVQGCRAGVACRGGVQGWREGRGGTQQPQSTPQLRAQTAGSCTSRGCQHGWARLACCRRSSAPHRTVLYRLPRRMRREVGGSRSRRRPRARRCHRRRVLVLAAPPRVAAPPPAHHAAAAALAAGAEKWAAALDFGAAPRSRTLRHVLRHALQVLLEPVDRLVVRHLAAPLGLGVNQGAALRRPRAGTRQAPLAQARLCDRRAAPHR